MELQKIGSHETVNNIGKTYVINGKSIYVIRTDDGSVKVGISKNVDARMKAIQCNSGKKIVDSYATGICSNAIEIESKAKEHFALKNIMGEWFSCEFDEMVNFVKSTYENNAQMDYVCNELREKEVGEMASKTVKYFHGQKEDSECPTTRMLLQTLLFLDDFGNNLLEQELYSSAEHVIKAYEIIKDSVTGETDIDLDFLFSVAKSSLHKSDVIMSG